MYNLPSMYLAFIFKVPHISLFKFYLLLVYYLRFEIKPPKKQCFGILNYCSISLKKGPINLKFSVHLLLPVSAELRNRKTLKKGQTFNNWQKILNPYECILDAVLKSLLMQICPRGIRHMVNHAFV